MMPKNILPLSFTLASYTDGVIVFSNVRANFNYVGVVKLSVSGRLILESVPVENATSISYVGLNNMSMQITQNNILTAIDGFVYVDLSKEFILRLFVNSNLNFDVTTISSNLLNISISAAIY